MEDEIRVTWGEETFNVGQYSSFKVGPFSMMTKVRPNETPEQAYHRAWKVLESQADAMFIAKRNAFHARFGVRL